MTKTESEFLRRRRRALQNPYAHIEQLEEARAASSKSISESRLHLQNQYAYLDGDGHFSAMRSDPQSKGRVVESAIKDAVRDLHVKLWRARRSPDQKPNDVLDVGTAATLVGFSMSLVPELGTFDVGGRRVRVAGSLDRIRRQIMISSSFRPSVQKFTAAHEIAHAILHPQIDILHRDRAVLGDVGARDEIEREADLFATLFLMPEKLVKSEFESRFLTQKLTLTDHSEHALGVVGKCVPRHDQLSRFLASTTQYNGRHFYSLVEYFGLSVEAVALRLEELELC